MPPAVLFFLRAFRVLAFVIFGGGLVIILISIYLTCFQGGVVYFNDTIITDRTQIGLLYLGFLAGWLLIGSIIIGSTSLKRKTETGLGKTLLVNRTLQSRFFGVVPLALGGGLLFMGNWQSGGTVTEKMFTVAGVVSICLGTWIILRVDRIRFDFQGGAYRHEKGFVFAPKISPGLFTDFESVLLKMVEQKDSESGCVLNAFEIYLTWKDQHQPPVFIDRRPRGFNDLMEPPPETALRQATELAQKLGIRLQNETKAEADLVNTIPNA